MSQHRTKRVTPTFSANIFQQMAFLRAVLDLARLLTLCEPSYTLKMDLPEPS